MMFYTSDECQVVQVLRDNERNVVATCINANWASAIAELLQKDWEA